MVRRIRQVVSVIGLMSVSAAAKVAWFQRKDPLRSRWAVDQERLDGAAGVLDIDVGRGKLFFNEVLYEPAATRRS